LIPLRGSGEIRKRVAGTDDVVRISPTVGIEGEIDLAQLKVSSRDGSPVIEFRGQVVPIDEKGAFALPIAEGQVIHGVVAKMGEVPVLIQTHLAPKADLDVLVLEV
jgi:hypothetical protein